jgi:hypothetical protein
MVLNDSASIVLQELSLPYGLHAPCMTRFLRVPDHRATPENSRLLPHGIASFDKAQQHI